SNCYEVLRILHCFPTRRSSDLPSQKVVATQYAKEQLSILKVGTVEQPILAKGADDMRIDWGYFYVAAPKEDKIVQYISTAAQARSEEHTSELQSRENLVCRLLL